MQIKVQACKACAIICTDQCDTVASSSTCTWQTGYIAGHALHLHLAWLVLNVLFVQHLYPCWLIIFCLITWMNFVLIIIFSYWCLLHQLESNTVQFQFQWNSSMPTMTINRTTKAIPACYCQQAKIAESCHNTALQSISESARLKYMHIMWLQSKWGSFSAWWWLVIAILTSWVADVI